MFGENRDAAIQMMEKYDPHLMGKIALALFKHHRTNQIILNLMKRQNLCTRQFSTSIMLNLICNIQVRNFIK